MKILKYLLYILFGVLALVLLIAIFISKDVDVNRSVVIDYPKETVWEYTNSLQDLRKWSPWAEKDPNMKYQFEGEEGAVGSTYSWEGDPESVGIGEQEITSIDPPERLESELRFTTPYENTMNGYVQLEDAGEGKTKAIYGVKSTSGWPMNIFNLFIEGMLDEDFNNAVNKLKKVVSEGEENKPDYDVKKSSVEKTYYLGKRETIDIPTLSDYFATNFPAIMESIGSQNATPQSMPLAIYYEFNEKTEKTDLAAAVKVDEEAVATGDFEIIELPPSDVLILDYYGSYEETMKGHMAIDTYMNENDIEYNGYAIEEYITDPGTEQDTSKWLTRITYYVK